MSYNCDKWITKELSNLRIPVSALYESERRDWHPERTENSDGIVRFEMMESHITGRVVDGVLIVEDIRIYGEGSGSLMHFIIEPALKKSLGKLEASTVWERGDSIQRLTVVDGEVLWTKIDL